MPNKLFNTVNLSLCIDSLSSIKQLNTIQVNRICIKGGVEAMKKKVLSNTLDYLTHVNKEIEKIFFNGNLIADNYKEVINIYKGVNCKVEVIEKSILNEIEKLFYRRIGKECILYRSIDIGVDGGVDVDGNIDFDRFIGFDVNDEELKVLEKINGFIDKGC